MTKTHNNLKNNKKKTIKINNGGKSDLSQKYSLNSIDEGVELGGFKYSNNIIGVLGISLFLYYVYLK
jgi:hypothetical protein